MSDDLDSCKVCGELIRIGAEYCKSCDLELFGPTDWEQVLKDVQQKEAEIARGSV